jgi:hypothetical protein
MVYVLEDKGRCCVGEYRELPDGRAVKVRKVALETPQAAALPSVFINKLVHDCVQAIARKHRRVRLL